ncbi:MAG: uroporphyrinogen decarboxylase family protein [Armatimonadota bacterium]
MMNQRERFVACMKFEPVDHVPDREFGYWDDTFTRWHEEGLPEEINNNTVADPFFGFESRMTVPAAVGMLPSFEGKILEETDEHRIVQDSEGVKKIIYTDGASTIPRYLEFPIKDRASWEQFKERLRIDDPARYRDDWEEIAERTRTSEIPVQINGGSLFGRLRNWIGFEQIAIMCYDDPELLVEMIEHMCQLACAVIQPAVEAGCEVDCGAFWEDINFKQGCIISPKFFHEWLTPRYQRITDLMYEMGAVTCYVDSDGNITDVLDGWLAGGVTCMFPVEVAAGSDPLAIREQWGREALMMGGVNKRALAAGRDAIDEELARLKPLVDEGGFIPHVDHRVPPDVSYDDYLYYLRTKREVFGIPEPTDAPMFST